MKEEIDDLALTIASMNGHALHSDYGDGLVETAKLYKMMTGVDLGIADLENTNQRIKQKAKPWYKRIFNPQSQE